MVDYEDEERLAREQVASFMRLRRRQGYSNNVIKEEISLIEDDIKQQVMRDSFGSLDFTSELGTETPDVIQERVNLFSMYSGVGLGGGYMPPARDCSTRIEPDLEGIEIMTQRDYAQLEFDESDGRDEEGYEGQLGVLLSKFLVID